MKESDFKQLNIARKEYDKVWLYCPFHNDTVRPNLSISLLDKYYGRWRCWACGKEGYLQKEQMDKLNLSMHTVYRNDRCNLMTRWALFAQDCKNNFNKYPLLKLGLAKQLNISIKSLDDWFIGYDGKSVTIPMFREDLPEYCRENGFCGAQRRFSDGSKRCITGSQLGLMYPYGDIGDYYIFICEGFSDGVSIWDLGLQSMARPNCRYVEGIKDLCTDGILTGIEKIIIIPDNDTVGIAGAEQLRDELDGLYYESDEWGEELVDIIIFSFDGAKDIREYIAKKGKQRVKKELGWLI